MQIPKNLTEKEVLDTIDNIANRLAARFRFGYYSIEDMKQEARLEAWKGLQKYDGVRPLENFLWTHVRNRLFNLKRNKFQRPNIPPCSTCNGEGCSKCMTRERRNNTKKNLMLPIELTDVRDDEEDNMKTYDDVVDNIEKEEIMALLDKEMPLDLRQDFIKVKYGIKVNKQKREAVYQEVLRILKENGYDEKAW